MYPDTFIKRCPEGTIQNAIINWDINKDSLLKLVFHFGSFKLYFRIRGKAIKSKPRVIVRFITNPEG